MIPPIRRRFPFGASAFSKKYSGARKPNEPSRCTEVSIVNTWKRKRDARHSSCVPSHGIPARAVSEPGPSWLSSTGVPERASRACSPIFDNEARSFVLERLRENERELDGRLAGEAQRRRPALGERDLPVRTDNDLITALLHNSVFSHRTPHAPPPSGRSPQNFQPAPDGTLRFPVAARHASTSVYPR